MHKVYSGFQYLTPKTVGEVCVFLAQYKKQATVLAGGTDVMVLLKGHAITPSYIIKLDAIKGLDYIVQDDKGLKIGALATMADIAGSTVVKERFPLLAYAADEMGSPQVRNTATVVGNLCRAAPSADTAPPLLALGAKLKVVSSAGERIVNLGDFFIGPGETVLRNDEMVIEIQIPNLPPNTYGVYTRTSSRAALSIAQVSAAVVVTLDSTKSSVVEARIVLGSVAPTPIRATQAEEALKGQTINDEIIKKAAGEAMSAAKPISDVRSSAAYRKEMVKALVERALRQVTAK